jgi:large subunit ribosomal protein L23Ae
MKTAVNKKIVKKGTERESFDAYKIIKFPLSTEKSIRQIEFENRLGFVISTQTTKTEVKKAVEELFKVKVVKVNLQNSFNGEKRAYVKLSKGHLASDVSADLGLI